jgi:hypothetical protein
MQRPRGLPDVEDELLVEPPRPVVWAASSRKLTARIEELLTHGAAVRAWVTEADTGWESGYEAGPYYKIDYAWEWETRTYTGRWAASFDAMHLGLGAPEYAAWLERSMCSGGSFTVLLDPERPSEPTIYGNLELFLQKTLLQAVEELRTCSEEELEDRASEVLAFIIAPLGRCRREWRDYFDLLSKLDMFDENKGAVRDHEANIEVVRTDIRAGRFDAKVLERLSEMCSRYRPGVWAAT